MSSVITVDEKQVLDVIREYFEKTGKVECLVALENSVDSPWAHQLPSKLAFFRKLCLNGKWNDANEYLQVFDELTEKDGFQACLYEATKQQYLEVISANSVDKPQSLFGSLSNTSVANEKASEGLRIKILTDLLTKLKGICPSQEDYSNLRSLVELPSLEASPQYADWSMFPARLRVFNVIATWMAKTIYPDLNTDSLFATIHSTHTHAASTRLVRLIAKGLLYEKCEQTCTNRCGEDRRESDMETFDLSGWMQQQPDSAYQISPSKCKLVVLPHLVPQDQHQNTLSKSLSVGTQLSQKPPLPKLSVTSQSVQEMKLNSSQIQTTEVVDDPQPPASPPAQHTSKQDSPPVEHPPADDLLKTTPNRSTGIQVREADSTHSNIRVLEEFEDNFVDMPPVIHQPQLKSGRDSSTPKPSSQKLPLQPSPPTSPVANDPHRTGDTPQRGRMVESTDGGADNVSLPRRHFDFNTTAEEVSIEWPTATLLCQVNDTQAVRSVAFSQYGSVVAIGANSKTLRLCSTAPLLDEKLRGELPVFYHHASYHRGSIYCLAWRGETLLVSGSNDQKLRLLSYDPSRTDSPCKSLGDISVHSGTVRDVCFTPGGLLVSGGAGDTALKISDCITKQLVGSLAGHTEQVLALDVLEENVIVSGSQDKTINLWDLRQGKSFLTFTSNHSVTSVSACPARNELVSAHTDGSCSVHDLTSSKTRGTYHPHTDDCRTARFSPRSGGQWIVSGSYDGTVCLAEPGSLEWEQVGEHSDKVVQCRWHCDGRVFATTGVDKRACFWTLN